MLSQLNNFSKSYYIDLFFLRESSVGYNTRFYLGFASKSKTTVSRVSGHALLLKLSIICFLHSVIVLFSPVPHYHFPPMCIQSVCQFILVPLYPIIGIVGLKMSSNIKYDSNTIVTGLKCFGLWNQNHQCKLQPGQNFI